MRVLLVAANSQYIHTTPALYALSRAAEQAGSAIELERFPGSINLPALDALAAIYEKRPDILAFSFYIWNAAYLAPLVTDLRRLLPRALFLAGGPEVSARPRHYLSALPLDGVCVGEGEECFAALFRALGREDFPLPPVDNAPPAPQEACSGAGKNGNPPGAARAEAAEIMPKRYAPPRLPETAYALPGWMWRGREADYRPAPLPDLAGLPFLYTEAEGADLAAAGKVVYYESSRGCPFSCAFCASAGQPLRERPLTLVLPELNRLAAIGGQIKFIDRTFNANPGRARAILARVLELYRPGLSWHFELSPFLLPEELLALLAAAPAGYLHLEVGVQTLNQQALAAVGRRGDWETAEPKIKRLIAAGARLHLDLIAGLPEDTPAAFAASFHRLHQLNAGYLQLGFLKLLPGSLLEARSERLGIVACAAPPYRVLATPTMSAEYLFALRQAERAFNALYNKTDECRAELIAKAESRPGGALALYEQAATLLPPGGLHPRERQKIVASL